MKFMQEYELSGGRQPMPKKQKQYDDPYKGKKPKKKDYSEERKAKRGE